MDLSFIRANNDSSEILARKVSIFVLNLSLLRIIGKFTWKFELFW